MERKPVPVAGDLQKGSPEGDTLTWPVSLGSLVP
jgi:hypothetical protein